MRDQSATANISGGVRRHADKLIAASAVLLILTGTVVYVILEDWSWVDSLYFCVVAVTTVGFGDLTPTSDGSKLFTVLYVLSGISIVSLWLNERLRHRGSVAQRKQDQQS